MATELIRWCDVHMGRDERVTGSPVPVSIGGHPPKVLDLCDGCRDEVIKPLEALLDEFGTPVAPTAPKGVRGPRKVVPGAAVLPGVVPADTDPDRPHVCLWCPATFTTGEGLHSHAHKQHGTPKGAGELWGHGCPVCGVELPASPGQHIGQAHKDYGFKSPSGAFAWARDNGDPHGLYAVVYAKGQAA